MVSRHVSPLLHYHLQEVHLQIDLGGSHAKHGFSITSHHGKAFFLSFFTTLYLLTARTQTRPRGGILLKADNPLDTSSCVRIFSLRLLGMKVKGWRVPLRLPASSSQLRR